MRRSSLAAIAIAALLSGCEMIGIESPEKVAAAREALLYECRGFQNDH